MNSMKRFYIILVLMLGLMFIGLDADAQCAMCKASAETSVESGSTKALGFNDAIFYLMSVPYLMGGIFIFIFIRNRRRKHREEQLSY